MELKLYEQVWGSNMALRKTEKDLQKKIEDCMLNMKMTVDNGSEYQKTEKVLFVESPENGYDGETKVSGDSKFTATIKVSKADGNRAIAASIAQAVVSHICEETELLQQERYDALEEDYNKLLSELNKHATQLTTIATQMTAAAVGFAAGCAAPTTAPLAAAATLYATAAGTMTSAAGALTAGITGINGGPSRAAYTKQMVSKEKKDGKVIK